MKKGYPEVCNGRYERMQRYAAVRYEEREGVVEENGEERKKDGKEVKGKEEEGLANCSFYK